MGNITTFYAGLSPYEHLNQYNDGQGFCLGNINETNLGSILKNTKLVQMLEDFTLSRNACQINCSYYKVCPGGFELTKLDRHGTFDVTETTECIIHVKALTDAIVDDLEEFVVSASGV